MKPAAAAASGVSDPAKLLSVPTMTTCTEMNTAQTTPIVESNARGTSRRGDKASPAGSEISS